MWLRLVKVDCIRPGVHLVEDELVGIRLILQNVY